jgi:hypothetical protein
MKFVCQTLFDITATGVTGHCKTSRMPFLDRAGQVISDETAWNRSRNQQRNWETLTQILSLRTQLFDLVEPIQDQTGTRWMFEFETETEGVYGSDSDPVSVLRSDAAGVPMLRELDNDPDIDTVLVTEGPRQNIWFAPISINKS